MKTLNNYIRIAMHILIVLLIFQSCRILFVIANKLFYSEIGIWEMLYLMAAGLKFDAIAVFLINIPYIILMLLPLTGKVNKIIKRVAKIFFIVTNLSAIVLGGIDILYFPYTMERLTIGFFYYLLTSHANMGILLWRFITQYWYAFASLIPLTYIVAQEYDRIEKFELPAAVKYMPSRVTVIIAIALVGLISTAGIMRKWHPSQNTGGEHNRNYTYTPLKAAVITNTPYYMLLSVLGTNKAAIPPELHTKEYKPKENTGFDKKNVVIFIIESFTREAMGALNPKLDNGTYKGYSPFLDSLMLQSHYFTNAYANGRRSIDAVPAILASTPAILKTPINSPMTSIATLLKKEGYTSQFFYGARNGSMQFDKFCEKSGFDEYFGFNEFNNPLEFDGTWSLWDEYLLQRMAERQNITQEPFLSAVFTSSSHNPYVLPEKYKGKIKEGIAPICKCIEYADISIREYFNTASKMPWFKNTIFVFTGDHAAIPWHKEYTTHDKAFAVPLFIYTPSENAGMKNDRIAQHIDILPTLLMKMNYPHPFLSAGNDLFDNNSEEWAITGIQGITQIVKKGRKVEWIKPNGEAVNPAN